MSEDFLGLDIQKAQSSDEAALIAVMDKANSFAGEKAGVNQWTNMPHAYGGFKKHISQGHVYKVMNKDQVIVAAVAVTDSDNDLWAEDGGSDKTALYFQKLMKDPELAPPNVGLGLIDFVAAQAIKNNKPKLRIDIKSRMEGLIAYYAKLGFNPIRTLFNPASEDLALLMEAEASDVQKKIAELTE